VRIKKFLIDSGYANIEIEVDGNISCENAKKMRAVGADIFVAGTSSLFIKGKDLKVSAGELRQCIE